jgi:gas vesicle protein GvpL/GvpF
VSVLLYGVVEVDGAASLGAGVDDLPLRAVADGPLMAIVSDHDDPGSLAAPEALDEYELTVQRLTDSRAILPAQFGRTLADDETVRAMLRRRRRDLLAKLDGVRGAV